MPKKKLTDMPDPLLPSPTILVNLGSAVIHAEEFFSKDGHPADKAAFNSNLRSPELQEWFKQMKALALLPLKRSER